MSAAEVRTTVSLPADLAEAVDNYWHTERLQSRPEAIRELLCLALDHKLTAKPAKEKTR
jgi:metal-responsive CopG/Arc/MetJ family transcriptional regulator